MATYNYPAGSETFGAKDQRPPGDAQKVIKGADMDSEFNAITSGKLDVSGTNFDGIIQGGTVDGGGF